MEKMSKSLKQEGSGNSGNSGIPGGDGNGNGVGPGNGSGDQMNPPDCTPMMIGPVLVVESVHEDVISVVSSWLVSVVICTSLHVCVMVPDVTTVVGRLGNGHSAGFVLLLEGG
jgi:hypothetical protein